MAESALWEVGQLTQMDFMQKQYFAYIYETKQGKYGKNSILTLMMYANHATDPPKNSAWLHHWSQLIIYQHNNSSQQTLYIILQFRFKTVKQKTQNNRYVKKHEVLQLCKGIWRNIVFQFFCSLQFFFNLLNINN